MFLSLTKKYFMVILIPLVLLGYQLHFGIFSFQQVDAIPKLIQLESLKRQGWNNPSIIYPGRDWNPDAELIPVPHNFFFLKDGEIQSVFPDFLAYFYSLFSFVSPEYLHYFNALFLLVLLFVYKKFLNLHSLSLLLLFFGTLLYTQYTGYSEYPVYLMLVGTGFIKLYSFLKEGKRNDFLLFSLLTGLSLFFRLESLLLYAIVTVFLLTEHYFETGKIYRKDLLSGLIVFGLLFFLFGSYNYYHYGHILGNRYVYNYDKPLPLKEKMMVFLEILFLRQKEKGIWNFGFFVFSSFLFTFLIWGLLHFRKFQPPEQKLFLIGLLILLLFPVLAPNPGYVFPGRYIVIAVFPLIILWDVYAKEIWKKPVFKVFLLLNFVVSVFLVYLFVYYSSTQQMVLRETMDRIRECKEEIVVFTHPGGLAIGLDPHIYFEKKVFLLETIPEGGKFLEILKNQETLQSFCFIKNGGFFSGLLDKQFDSLFLYHLQKRRISCIKKASVEIMNVHIADLYLCNKFTPDMN